MDVADFTRLVVLILYLVVAGVAGVMFRQIDNPWRRMSVVFIGATAAVWAGFYLWITPLFWGTYAGVDSARSFAGLVSRLIHAPTAATLAVLLIMIYRAETERISRLEVEAARLRAALGQDDC